MTEQTVDVEIVQEEDNPDEDVKANPNKEYVMEEGEKRNLGVKKVSVNEKEDVEEEKFKVIIKGDLKGDTNKKNDEEDAITTDLALPLPIETAGDNASKRHVTGETTRIIRSKTNLRITLILK